MIPSNWSLLFSFSVLVFSQTDIFIRINYTQEHILFTQDMSSMRGVDNKLPTFKVNLVSIFFSFCWLYILMINNNNTFIFSVLICFFIYFFIYFNFHLFLYFFSRAIVVASKQKTQKERQRRQLKFEKENFN